MAFPQLIAFDLDYTLWDLWISNASGIDPSQTQPPLLELLLGPLHRQGNTINKILDQNNIPIAFYNDAPAILHRIQAEPTSIAVCSRTSASDLAYDALRLLLLPPAPGTTQPTPAIEFFDQLEIYPGSKITHFERLHRNTGIPYSQMLFFDDESRNQEVEKLGVTFQLIPVEGLTHKVFEQGLALWKQRSTTIIESA